MQSNGHGSERALRGAGSRVGRLCLALLVLLAGAVATTESRAGPAPRFEGYVGPAATGQASRQKAFVKFLEGKERRIVSLEIHLGEAQWKQMREPEPEDGVGKRYFFTIPDDPGAPHLGGTSVHILVSPDDDFFFDSRPEAPRVSGYFKIVGATGPQMGYLVYVLKPVKIEDVPR